MVHVPLLALLCVCARGETAPQPSTAAFQMPAQDVVQLGDLALGKWRIAPDLTPAHWIGDPEVTTGDHDGVAVRLVADKKE